VACNVRDRFAGFSAARGFRGWVTGDVDMRSLLSDPSINGTIFEPLRDPAVFAQARVVLGAIEWPNGADLAPDAMYDAIREYSVWVLD
jgi:Protein of unknown function (DUF2442)